MPDPSDKTLSAAQRLNYDILSTIFIIAASRRKTVALKMCKMCRLWRQAALSTPRIWSEIDLKASITPYTLSIYLERSSPLPLSISISESDLSNNRVLRTLSTVTDRIITMNISEYEGIVPHQDPGSAALGRVQFAPFTSVKALQDISKASQSPQSREIHFDLLIDSFYRLAASQNGFTVLQKLELSCQSLSDWH